ncbi:CHASE2 domain-containing protein [Marinobacter salicampi]|uniref:CHASE2 domain-containing protein n=1 Tax=Marinobacter salicampi TaxID=435907 RepID=UPI00140AD7B0|nr:CHASE2 domain-containing protein [Marinobacter salicampi]
MQSAITSKSFFGTLRRHWLILVVGYVLALVDPFGISSTTSKAITGAFDRLFSPFYSASLAAGGDSGSANLVDVILIDDPSIRALSDENNGYLRANDWPLAYSDHGVLIDALRRRGYGTVILDITFYRARNLDPSFANLVTRMEHFRNNAEMAVILSSGDDPAELESSIEPLVNAASGLGMTGWVGYGEHYPLSIHMEGVEVLTLAAAAYQAYCQVTGWQGCDDLSKADSTWLVPEPGGMHMSWGMPARSMTPSLNCVGPEAGSSWSELFHISRRSLFGAEDVSSRHSQVCPPLPTATLSDVFCSGPDCYPFIQQGQTEKRIAMVGVSLPSVRDLFDPPGPGQLPGVYLHAEALRNLLHYGSNYFQPVGLQPSLSMFGLPNWPVPVDLLLAWPLLLWGVVALSRKLLYWRHKNQRRAHWPELAMEVVEVALVLIALCLIYLLALSFQRTPGFLADLIAFTPLLLIAIRNERKEMNNESLPLDFSAFAPEQPGLGRGPVHRKVP